MFKLKLLYISKVLAYELNIDNHNKYRYSFFFFYTKLKAYYIEKKFLYILNRNVFKNHIFVFI